MALKRLCFVTWTGGEERRGGERPVTSDQGSQGLRDKDQWRVIKEDFAKRAW